MVVVVVVVVVAEAIVGNADVSDPTTIDAPTAWRVSLRIHVGAIRRATLLVRVRLAATSLTDCRASRIPTKVEASSQSPSPTTPHLRTSTAWSVGVDPVSTSIRMPATIANAANAAIAPNETRARRLDGSCCVDVVEVVEIIVMGPIRR